MLLLQSSTLARYLQDHASKQARIIYEVIVVDVFDVRDRFSLKLINESLDCLGFEKEKNSSISNIGYDGPMAGGCANPIGPLTCSLFFLNDVAFLRFSSTSRKLHHKFFSSTAKIRIRKCTVFLRPATSCCNEISHGNSPAEILQQIYSGSTLRYNKLVAINSSPFGTHLAETYFMSS